MRAGKVDVFVSEGRVALAASRENERLSGLSETVGSTASTLAAEVGAGHKAVFSDTIETISAVESDVMARQLSWRDGYLAFSGEPLSQVVEDVSRYTDIAIVISDNEIRNIPVSGFLKISKMDEMVEALEVMADLEVKQVGARQFYLSRKSDG